MINPYGPPGAPATKLFLIHRLALPKPREWTLIEPQSGHINALDKIAGIAVASNGILVALLTPRLEILFGHREWFIPLHNGPSHSSHKAEAEQTPDISEYY